MLSILDQGLQQQAASIGQYYRIANINESTAELAKEAQEHGAILQRKGTKIVIATRLMLGFRKIHCSFKPDSPEAA